MLNVGILPQVHKPNLTSKKIITETSDSKYIKRTLNVFLEIFFQLQGAV